MSRINAETSQHIQKTIAHAVSNLNTDQWNRSVMTAPSADKMKLRIILAKEGAKVAMSPGGLKGVRFAEVLPEAVDSVVVGFFPDASAGVPFDNPCGIGYVRDTEESLEEFAALIAKDIYAYLEDGTEPSDLTLG